MVIVAYLGVIWNDSKKPRYCLQAIKFIDLNTLLQF